MGFTKTKRGRPALNRTLEETREAEKDCRQKDHLKHRYVRLYKMRERYNHQADLDQRVRRTRKAVVADNPLFDEAAARRRLRQVRMTGGTIIALADCKPLAVWGKFLVSKIRNTPGPNPYTVLQPLEAQLKMYADEIEVLWDETLTLPIPRDGAHFQEFREARRHARDYYIAICDIIQHSQEGDLADAYKNQTCFFQM